MTEALSDAVAVAVADGRTAVDRGLRTVVQHRRPESVHVVVDPQISRPRGAP